MKCLYLIIFGENVSESIKETKVRRLAYMNWFRMAAAVTLLLSFGISLYTSPLKNVGELSTNQSMELKPIALAQLFSSELSVGKVEALNGRDQNSYLKQMVQLQNEVQYLASEKKYWSETKRSSATIPKRLRLAKIELKRYDVAELEIFELPQYLSLSHEYMSNLLQPNHTEEENVDKKSSGKSWFAGGGIYARTNRCFVQYRPV